MKYVYYIMLLIPVSFLFHFYEYGQYLKREPATFLGFGWILYIGITGILSVNHKKRYVLLMQTIACGISLLLAHFLIEDNGAWFKPFGRDAAVVFIAIVTVIGQLLLRSFLKIIIYFSDRENVSS